MGTKDSMRQKLALVAYATLVEEKARELKQSKVNFTYSRFFSTDNIGYRELWSDYTVKQNMQ